MSRNSSPNSEQLRIASLLGLDVMSDTEIVAAAKIEDAVAPAINPGEVPRKATERQVEFGIALGLSLDGESLRIASAKIDEELFRRNRAAAESLDLKPGDHVVKKQVHTFDGRCLTVEREFVISSICEHSFRVWFRGGNGQGAWPTQLKRVDAAKSDAHFRSTESISS